MNFAAVLAVEAFATDAAATTGRGVPPEIVTGVGDEANPLATTLKVADPSSMPAGRVKVTEEGVPGAIDVEVTFTAFA